MKGILIGDNGDIEINVVRDESGKIVSGWTVGDSDYQNVDLVVVANKGDFKEYPVLGVGAERYLKSVGRTNDLRREISVQLAAIGYAKADVKVSKDGIIEIDV